MLFKLSKHPLNLSLRFILEMAALFALVLWAWTQHEGWLRNLLAVGLPMLFALIWGIFAVSNDPSRSGKTVVETRGWIRLALELALFGIAGWAFYDSGYVMVSWIFLSVVVFHYIISMDRVKWLLKQ